MSRRVTLAGWLLAFLLWAPGLLAHPMGNFSVNRYAKITVGAGEVNVLYLVDFAEIPTYQQMRELGLDPTGSPGALDAYLSEQAQSLGKRLRIELDRESLRLDCVQKRASFSAGAGGLPTLKIGFVYRATLPEAKGAAARQLQYSDGNFEGRAGWKEVVVSAAQGANIVQSSAPNKDRSQELTNYATDLLASPPQETSASVKFNVVLGVLRAKPGAAPVSNTKVADRLSAERPKMQPPLAGAPAAKVAKRSAVAASALALQSPKDAKAVTRIELRPNRQTTPRSHFTELLNAQGRFSFWFLLSSAFIAAGLGALHALEPGHGKTIVGAYLVGSRGTARHAVLLGVVVTASHVVGVYLLGFVTLYASRYIVPEQLYPWLGAISGTTIAGLGTLLLLRHISGQSGQHSHVSGEAHSHYFLSSSQKANPANRSGPASQQTVSWKQLCLLGITGGIVPCPAALVVLLGAFSLHRIGFGLFLITAFSLGLALVLVAVGLAMVSAKKLVARLGRFERAQRIRPAVSSSMMVLIGIGVAVSAFAPLPAMASLLTRDKLAPFLTVILLGLFLGMRHSTDPDHVVAVSTIVSREGSIRSSAAIGALWGLGHTLTIFLVGAGIIVFGLVIPPRLGLAMEFSVAVMLILLGVLNLTGTLGRITKKFSPQIPATERSRDLGGSFDRALGRFGIYQTIRPLVIGLVHGLAGSAAVALLVLSTIKSPFWATAYLLVFGLGTTAGMMLMTVGMSFPLVYTGKRYQRASSFLITASGVVSVGFGLLLVYRIGVVDGLFSSAPHWIPS